MISEELSLDIKRHHRVAMANILFNYYFPYSAHLGQEPKKWVKTQYNTIFVV